MNSYLYSSTVWADELQLPVLRQALFVVRHFRKILRLTNIILTIAFLTDILSCSRMKRKGHEVIDKTQEKVNATKQKIIDKKDQLIDKAFAPSDVGKPDSENNKKRFKEYLNVDLTKDIKNIYSYADFFGADYKVLVSFTCDTSTISKIIKSKGLMLSKDENDDGLFFGEEFFWWDKQAIENIKPFKEGKELEYWKYLWFDKKKKTAYYEEFSL